MIPLPSIRNPTRILSNLKSLSLRTQLPTLPFLQQQQQQQQPQLHSSSSDSDSKQEPSCNIPGIRISKLLNSKTNHWETLSTHFSPQLFLQQPNLVEDTLLHLNHPSHASKALSFFHWLSSSSQTPNSLRSYCLLVHILLRADLPLHAAPLLRSAISSNTSSSTPALLDTLFDTYDLAPSGPRVFDLLVRSYVKLRLLDPAFHAFRLIADRRGNLCPPSVATANSILYLASTSDGRCEFAWEVYEYMLDKRIYPNGTTLQIMVNVMRKEGTLTKTLATLGRIYGSSCGPAVVVNLRLAFKVFEDDRVEHGILLLRRLLQKNLTHDRVVNSLVIYGHCKLNNLEVAFGLYNDMLKRGYCTNAFVYTSFIGAHCKEGRIEEAVRLVEEMVHAGLKPYDETYSLLVEACSRFGRLDVGFGFYERMLKERILPNSAACNEMIGRLCEEGDAEKANEIMTVLMDKGFVPDKEIYLKLIDGFGKIGKAQEVLKLKYEMEYKGL